MSALGSPLEALAFNYLSFVWAWIAVITAAVSVWRIRASSPRCKGLNRESSLLTSFSTSSSSSSSSSSSEFERVGVAAKAEVQVSVQSRSPFSVFQTEGRTSGKFALYYREAVEVEEEESDCENDDIDCLDDGVCREWLGNSWKGTMTMRMNGMGWYHFQDLTVLNGNVVRLWEDCRRRNAAPLSMYTAARGGEDGSISWKLIS